MKTVSLNEWYADMVNKLSLFKEWYETREDWEVAESESFTMGDWDEQFAFFCESSEE